MDDTQIYTEREAHTRTPIHTHMHTHTHTHLQQYIHVYTHKYNMHSYRIHAYFHNHTIAIVSNDQMSHTFTHTHTHMYIHSFMCVYKHIYIYIVNMHTFTPCGYSGCHSQQRSDCRQCRGQCQLETKSGRLSRDRQQNLPSLGGCRTTSRQSRRQA